MTLLLAAALCAVVALTGFLQRRREQAGQSASAAAWYKMRQSELEHDSQVSGIDTGVLEEELQLSLLENNVDDSTDLRQSVTVSIPLQFLLIAVLVAASAITYHRFGGYQDVLLSQSLQEVTPEDNEIELLIAQVRPGLQNDPRTFII